MATLLYATGGRTPRFFKIKKKNNSGSVSGEVSRISCAEYNNSKIGYTKPNVNDKVIIIIKPYNQYTCKTGIVTDVLTKKQQHTRGHKVKINSGGIIYIGRTLKIL